MVAGADEGGKGVAALLALSRILIELLAVFLSLLSGVRARALTFSPPATELLSVFAFV